MADLLTPIGLTSNDVATNLASVSDETGGLPSNGILSSNSLPLMDAGSAPPTQPSADAMLDAQAIQAQVEALIQSTSSSVASHTSGPDPISSLLSEPILPTPSSSVTSAAANTPIAPLAAGQGTGTSNPTAPALDQVSHSAGGNLPDSSATHDAAAAAAAAASSSFQNTFAQYQFPQNYDRGLKEAARATSAETSRMQGPAPPPLDQKKAVKTDAMTREEEERAADALIADIVVNQDALDAGTQQVKPEPFSGADLAAAAKAIGLEADSELLDGMSEDQRALAAAIKRLDAEHGEAAHKAVQQAAAAAAAAAAARASQELARAAAKEQVGAGSPFTGSPPIAGPSTPASAASPGSKSGSGPVKRFPCPKCDKAFARAYNLNTHLSTHDPDPNRSKPFPCPYPSCKSEGGRSFSRKHDLQRHVASIHENEAQPGIHGDPEEVDGGDTGGLVSLGLGTPGKKFRCNGCGRSFVRRDACNRHQCDDKDSPSNRSSRSPSSTRYASSVSPKPKSSQSHYGGSAVTLPLARPIGSASPASAAYRSTARGSHSPVGGSSSQAAGGRPSSSLSKEVQAVAQQLQARVQAQSPGPHSHGPPHRTVASLPSGERRNFPLSAISLYASTSSPGMHSSSGSSSSSSKIQTAK